MGPRYKLFAAIAALSLVLDQLTKYWARQSLTLGKDVAVIGKFWLWRLSYNTGSAFGLFSSIGPARVMLSLVGIAACVAIFMILRKATDRQTWLTSALALVAGGALGNVIDRVLFAKVTDFVVWKYSSHEWPAFNVADAALVIGVAIMFLDVGRDQKKNKA